MGVSTDAILAYGFNLGEGYDLPFDIEDDDDLIDYATNLLLDKLAGFTEKWSPEKEDYWKRKNEAVKNINVKVDMHCSCEYPMYTLIIKDSETNASRGYPKKISALDIGDNWNAALEEAVNALGIDLKDEKPSWLLYSLWC